MPKTVAISLTLPADLLKESDRIAESLDVSRAEYIRTALQEKNQRNQRQSRRDRMQRASDKVRGGSNVNEADDDRDS